MKSIQRIWALYCSWVFTAFNPILYYAKSRYYIENEEVSIELTSDACKFFPNATFKVVKEEFKVPNVTDIIVNKELKGQQSVLV